MIENVAVSNRSSGVAVTPYNHTRTQAVFGSPSQRIQLNPTTGPAFWLVSRPGAATITATEQAVFTAAMAYGRTRLERAYAVISMRIAGTPPGTGIVPANFRHYLRVLLSTGRGSRHNQFHHDHGSRQPEPH